MKKIKIPDEYVSKVLQISELSAEGVEEIVQLIKARTPRLFDSDLAREVAVEVKLTDVDVAEGVIEAVTSMYPSASMGAEFTPEGFAEEIVTDLLEQVDDDDLSKIDLNLFKKNLTTLLSISALEVVAKGTALAIENTKNFLHSQVITDVRPIFTGQDVEISGVLVVQTLTLTVFEPGSTRERFSVALDSADIRSLIETLERAEKKATSVKEKFSALSIDVLEPKFESEGA